ncbi:uncharacterized protein A1O5_05133 [Cladophialophora psammophila CBS 110553]|uniref:Xylanolytic transcriptional activator regulatory domain-containing protein n=1 Tax=Cladophialophora psammophila CBS 110553 TaxID=1182543 RepID=W9WT23_9EURO|nr:uncharacterized protein A1O5_05133 [Cladophialophora psammophila CBS 110553]EXJ71327.1 hypothetical protein A1O5_05133 [Cladophialophora psammophila CBS 110553]
MKAMGGGALTANQDATVNWGSFTPPLRYRTINSGAVCYVQGYIDTPRLPSPLGTSGIRILKLLLPIGRIPLEMLPATSTKPTDWAPSKHKWPKCESSWMTQPVPSTLSQTAASHTDLDTRIADTSPSDRLPPWGVVGYFVQLYLKYCNCQPLPLFSSEDLTTTFSSRDPELILAMLALASRFDPDNSAVSQADLSRTFESRATPARDMIMRRVTHGPVELSTIQALCLLSVAEFNHGNTPRASTYISLAIDLVSSSGLSSEHRRPNCDYIDDERRRCYWSVVLLRNLYGVSPSTFSFVQDERTPRLPQRPQPPLGISCQITDAALEQPDGPSSSNEPSDHGIFAYVVQLSQVWQRAARFANRRGNVGSLPAWSPQSEYSQITAELMEVETRLPYKYRFRPSRFLNQDHHELEQHRDFWASWILLQILYHTILCLLNHPLLLFLRLRDFRVTMVPEVFLQHTADLTETHTEWVIHMLDLCEKNEFRLFDPFLAHCAAIAATIYLQQSFSDDNEVRTAKQRSFGKCVSFIRDLGSFWPYVNQLADKIEDFEKVVSNSFRDSASQRPPNSRISIDLSLFWEIIEASFVSELPQDADGYFGASLTSHRRSSSSGEVLRSRLLPKPTRLNHHSIGSRFEDAESTSALLSRDSTENSEVRTADFMNEEVSILAQSYFAQGQDLAGSLDDWWLSGQPT